MFTIYYSNQLEKQKDILAFLFESLPNDDPFQKDIILVQSPGMAQWLQMELAKKNGIAANLAFPMPASFIWQLYKDNLPNVGENNPFDKDSMMWRLMRLIPAFLSQDDFAPLRHYLASSPHSEQYKLYQLSSKIADLFDQYLVYRPEWIFAWEAGNDESISAQIKAQQANLNDTLLAQIQGNTHWQGQLWRALVADVKADMGDQATHRAHLHQQFLALLQDENASKNLPSRVFIFGIPALPSAYLATLQAMSSQVDVHLFFNNPCQEYWGDLRDLRMEYLRSRTRRDYAKQDENQPLFSSVQLERLENDQFDFTYQDETLQQGNPLLAAWGKMGRDFLYTLVQDEERIETYPLNAYQEIKGESLLGQLQSQILHFENAPLNWEKNDRSLTLHACHSAMREVEVLHDYLLDLFNQDPTLTPKDVVVMVADINQYTPYIQAVFGQKNGDAPLIPFSISDNKLSESDVLVASYLSLLHLKESTFSAEDMLALLDVPAVRERFDIPLADLPLVRSWVADAGIRFGLEKQENGINFNSWQAGLERMMLGYAMREEHGIWQESLGFDSSYGLKGELAGKLSQFFTALSDWHSKLQHTHSMNEWEVILLELLDHFFVENADTLDTRTYLQEQIHTLAENLDALHFSESLQADVIADVITLKVEETPNSVKFLAGKVNFCTLLPMRSVPFKAVCLLGMNDADYPRSSTPNSFDLMQYHHQKGDRVRRDDDRYLFLEALLAARDYCYISYVGRSITDNQLKEPSVLVSQLLDYINQGQKNKLQVIEHAMTAFSPANFQNQENFTCSFATKWLPMAQTNARTQTAEFAVQMESAGENITEIELDRLVSFVENPVKFFFEKQLGVYFRNEDDRIADSENFTLDGLDRYSLNNDLVYFEEQDFAQYFEQSAVKGVLPRAEFGKVTAANIQENVLQFKEKIADLGEPKHLSVDVEINVEHQGETKAIRVMGYMSPLFGDDHQVIQWRFANYKDRYLIRPWVYYLIQLVTQENAIAPKLITQNRVSEFAPITPEQAMLQLQMYVQAYLQSQQEIQLVPTVSNIKDFILKEESAANFELISMKLKVLAEGDNFGTRADPYWARVLAQTTKFEQPENLKALCEQTKAWFGLLFSEDSKKSTKKSTEKGAK